MFAPQTMGPMMAAQPIPASPSFNNNDGLRRSNSLTWRHEAGLPPPPSEIDQFPNLQNHLQPMNDAIQRTKSPFIYDDTPASLGGHNDAEAMPMHAVTKHPKIKLKVILASSIFEAGATISGMLEITSSTSQRLRLGEIAVELEAFEELSSRDHAATQIFLFNRTLFQGEHLPPSNAVLPSAPVQGHWTARKGRTTFPFSFRLPLSAPSSCSFGGNANVRYTLKGTAQTWWNETKSLVTVRSEAFVVERWHDELDPHYREPVEAIADTHVFMGGSGAVWLEAGITERLFVAGGLLMIRAGVKNNSKRHLSGIKVSIARKLVFPASGPPGKPAQRPSLEPQITEVIHSQAFKGPSYEFPPNEEVVVNLAVDVPREVRSIRKTRLFEVHTVAIVSAQMGNFAKDLCVEIPMFVAHPGSVQHRHNASSQSRPQTFEPLAHLPQRSRSAMAQHGQHRNETSPMPPQSPALHNASFDSAAQAYHPDLSMAQVEAYAVQRGWSPAPFGQSPTPVMPPSRPTSAAAATGAVAQMPHGMIMIPSTPQPFSLQEIDHRQQFAYHAQQGQEWNPSTLLANVGQPHVKQQQMQTQVPARPHSAQDASSTYMTRNNHAAPTHLGVHANREATAGSTHLLTQRQVDHQTTEAAAKPYRRNSAPPSTDHDAYAGPAPSQEQREEEPVESLSVPYVPSPSQLLGANGQPVGLATIEEDSESAAGTVRSVRTLIGSVTRGDIDQFEEMARRAEDEEDVRKAMHAVGMVPDPRVVTKTDKTLPKMPASSQPSSESAKAAHSTQHVIATTRPKAADIFNIPAKETIVTSANKQNSAEQKKRQEEQLPIRPASAQGVGLAALESRLDAGKQSTSVVKGSSKGRKSEPAMRTSESITPSAASRPIQVMANVGTRDKAIGVSEHLSSKQNGALTAAEREQRARREELARLRKETEEEQTLKKAAEKALASAEKASEETRGSVTASDRTSSALPGSTSSSEKRQSVGERKPVNVKEQRMLTKEAVGRVNGWLSTSPSRELNKKRSDGAILPKEEEDLALSPKTPSPSVLRAEPEDLSEDKDLHIPALTSDSEVLRTLALSDKTTGAEDVTLSADLRALIDGTKTLPKPKKGSSISNHPSSRRFSAERDSSDSKKPSVASSASTQRKPLNEKSSNIAKTETPFTSAQDTGDIKVPASFAKAFDRSSLRLQDEEGGKGSSSRYDVRSARGGRGGRVASVATMWASIADGTDGSQLKDATPVLTLKPKAIRTGAVQLDFSTSQSEVSSAQSPTSSKPKTSIASPLVIVNNKVTSPTHKPSGAAHFINTTMPKPIFSSKAGEAKKQSQKGNAADSVPLNTRALSSANHTSSADNVGKLKASRKITSDLIAAEARMRAGRDLAKDAENALGSGIDSVNLEPMNGRGTTKPIGRDRLADLRSLWGG